jgi:hydrogenase-4 component E
MNTLLVAFELVLLIPLFVASWRTSLMGLACQGLLMGWLAYGHEARWSLDEVVTEFDVVVLRGLLAPVVLYRVLAARNAPSRHDVIAPSMFSWAVAIGLVLLAFRFADTAVPVEGEAQMLVAVAGSAILLGLLVLGQSSKPLGQIIGLLRVENGIALFELGVEGPTMATGIRLAHAGVTLATILFCRRYLVEVNDDAAVPEARRSNATL